MTDPSAQEAELIAIIQRFKGDRTATTRETEIWQDLHIGGDDAGEFLDEISTRFGVSFAGLHFPIYFPNEGECGPISYWAKKLGYRDKARRPITVNHLLEVIQRGAWFDPE